MISHCHDAETSGSRGHTCARATAAFFIGSITAITAISLAAGNSWPKLFRFRSEQLQIEHSSFEKHLVECIVNVRVGDIACSIRLNVKLHNATHKFFDEGRTYTFSSLGDLGNSVFGHRNTLRIQSHELGPSLFIGKWELDRLINTTGSCRQCRFESFGAIGGEKKQDVRFFFQPVHFVEQFVQ